MPGPSARKEEKESADKPGFVEGNHSSGMRVAAHLERPTRKPAWAMRANHQKLAIGVLPYLVLLQAGFAMPPSVTTGAVRSYRTISPLPTPSLPLPPQAGEGNGWGQAVCFLLHFPWTHVPQVLPGALP